MAYTSKTLKLIRIATFAYCIASCQPKNKVEQPRLCDDNNLQFFLIHNRFVTGGFEFNFVVDHSFEYTELGHEYSGKWELTPCTNDSTEREIKIVFTSEHPKTFNKTDLVKIVHVLEDKVEIRCTNRYMQNDPLAKYDDKFLFFDLRTDGIDSAQFDSSVYIAAKAALEMDEMMRTQAQVQLMQMKFVDEFEIDWYNGVMIVPVDHIWELSRVTEYPFDHDKYIGTKKVSENLCVRPKKEVSRSYNSTAPGFENSTYKDLVPVSISIDGYDYCKEDLNFSFYKREHWADSYTIDKLQVTEGQSVCIPSFENGGTGIYITFHVKDYSKEIESSNVK